MEKKRRNAIPSSGTPGAPYPCPPVRSLRYCPKEVAKNLHSILIYPATQMPSSKTNLIITNGRVHKSLFCKSHILVHKLARTQILEILKLKFSSYMETFTIREHEDYDSMCGGKVIFVK